jgi:hypothetical protein
LPACIARSKIVHRSESNVTLEFDNMRIWAAGLYAIDASIAGSVVNNDYFEIAKGLRG